MDGLDFFAVGAMDGLDFFAAGIGLIAAKAAALAAVSAVAEVSAAEERVGCGEGSSDWPCYELFQIFWWVVDCRACTGTRLCLYRYKVDGCTGTAIGACTGTEPQSPATRASGLDFVDLVPVQEPVYLYKGADFVQFEL
uniref:Uncharacterized protein n=1 Tax=Ananas comosus var. bracteatus TaxID=296719 RepID=A0A6V7P212_ANACO|nr:unnamed protein product [Ananas comosus var. bracteatus]